MKIIPLEGLKIDQSTDVLVQAYSYKFLAEAFNWTLNEDEKEEIYTDYIAFCRKDKLKYKKISARDIKNIFDKFPKAESFAIMNTRFNKYSEFYDLKVAISIMYLANRMKTETETDFFKQIYLRSGYHTKKGVTLTNCHLSIGTKGVDENDYDLTIPVYYTMDEDIESWRTPTHYHNFLNISEDIKNEVDEISLAIIKPNKMSTKLRSALYLVFNTLKFDNIDLVVIMYSTILETLLLSDNEDTQRKKVSVRAACLISNSEKKERKEYIAYWVNYFYKYRNAIVHDGKSFINLQQGSEFVIFDHTLSLIQHLIFNIIKIIIKEDISDISDIKTIVKSNINIDGLENGFDYIGENMTLNYEED